jgi:class 3 adenylate cyclase
MVDLSHDELKAITRVTGEADRLIETCVRDRLSLRALMERFLPALDGWLGAKGALVTTRNEHLLEETFTWGQWQLLGGVDLLAGEGLAQVHGHGTALWMALRLAGQEVGRIAVILDGDRTTDAPRLQRLLEATCAELDVVLATVHTAAHKQRMIVEVEEVLADPVFDRGVDRAVEALYREISVPDFVLLYRDEVDEGRLRYRVYRDGKLTASTDGPTSATLDAAIDAQGAALIDPDSHLLTRAAGLPFGVETALSSGMTRASRLGKVVCSAGERGFSAFALDVVEVMCEAMAQRLVDWGRERRHLAQFFSPRTIGELLRDPAYHDHYLTPREQTIAVLYADINSFTKISEQVLVEPALIASFVDKWSAGAVRLLWDHGGVFDKMVGDCVIGLFGPPFFRDTPEACAIMALKAAEGIARFTTQLGDEAPYTRIGSSGVVPGLGVAIGLNLCPMSVGLMGPNQDYTGFSSGMNSTARLQSLAGFRETFVMDSLYDAVARSSDPFVGRVGFGEARETAVKNVKHPLRYRPVTFR